jgi:hypothetical protein
VTAVILCCCLILPRVCLSQSQGSPPADSSKQSNPDQTQGPPTSSSQAPQPKPLAPPPKAPSATKNEQEKEIEGEEQSQRVLGVVPQFAVTSRQNAPPLSTTEKFHLFAKSAFDPVTVTIAGLQAGLGQATNEFPGYGQGAQGYGKRFGASLADEVSSGFWSNFFLPVLLREDPRYFRLGEGSTKHRILYGLGQELVAHSDRGGRTFNFSNMLGAFATGGLSNLYYPSSDRGAGLTLSRSAISIGYGTAGGLFDEFWPDIHRRLFHKHEKDK